MVRVLRFFPSLDSCLTITPRRKCYSHIHIFLYPNPSLYSSLSLSNKCHSPQRVIKYSLVLFLRSYLKQPSRHLKTNSRSQRMQNEPSQPPRILTASTSPSSSSSSTFGPYNPIMQEGLNAHAPYPPPPLVVYQKKQ